MTRPYAVRNGESIYVACDFATACALSASQHRGTRYTASTVLSGRCYAATIAADSYDVALRLFQALLRAERIHGVTNIVIRPAAD